MFLINAIIVDVHFIPQEEWKYNSKCKLAKGRYVIN